MFFGMGACPSAPQHAGLGSVACTGYGRMAKEGSLQRLRHAQKPVKASSNVGLQPGKAESKRKSKNTSMHNLLRSLVTRNVQLQPGKAKSLT